MSSTPGISPLTPDIEDIRNSERDGETTIPPQDTQEDEATNVVPGRDGEIAEQTGR